MVPGIANTGRPLLSSTSACSWAKVVPSARMTTTCPAAARNGCRSSIGLAGGRVGEREVQVAALADDGVAAELDADAVDDDLPRALGEDDRRRCVAGDGDVLALVDVAHLALLPELGVDDVPAGGREGEVDGELARPCRSAPGGRARTCRGRRGWR